MSWTRLLIFLAVFSTVVGGSHYYLWARLVRDAALPDPWRRGLTAVLVALALSIPATMVAMRSASRDVVAPFAWVAFTWLGLVFFLIVMLLPLEVARLATLVGPGPIDPARRMFLGRLFAGLAALGAAATGLASFFMAVRPVGVKRVEVPIPRLPERLRGFSIAQITDVHVGPMIGRDFIEHVVETVNGLGADVVAITGDLVDGSVQELGELVAPLQRLRARHGSFFVTGNHEYYSGHEPWIRFLESLGVRVLRNERVTLDHGDGARLDLAGVNDWRAGTFDDAPDVGRAVAGRDPASPLVLLAHQPKHADEAARHGVSLQLSGHTHGGQIFPFNYLVQLDQPFVAGLHRLAETAIYVSRGTGWWGPPMRLAAPAEVTHLVLVPA